jgi:predicted O-methyltransferase YrrM/DNA-binding PadR family transcriptional regulator
MQTDHEENTSHVPDADGRRGAGRRHRSGGGRGRGGGRRGGSRRGSVRGAILVLLTEGPMHGYQMLRVMEERSGGRWKPSPGSLYPMLQALEDEGLLLSGDHEGRRTYELTEAGRGEIAAGGVVAPWQGQEECREDRPDTLDTALRALRSAVGHVEDTAGPDERAATVALIESVRRSVYLLLAGQPDPAARRPDPGRADWSAVDESVERVLAGPDEHLDAALANASAAGLPRIQVSPLQGGLLAIFARAVGARRILEVGTLGGYSAIWLARTLPPGGRLISLEVDPHHAEVALRNVADAGLADRVDIRVGPALQALDGMTAGPEDLFDLVFIDADKQSNAAYLRAALNLTRPGGLIVIDNMVRSLGPRATGPGAEAAREILDIFATDLRIEGTIVQTVGKRGWDGFAIGVITTVPASRLCRCPAPWRPGQPRVQVSQAWSLGGAHVLLQRVPEHLGVPARAQAFRPLEQWSGRVLTRDPGGLLGHRSQLPALSLRGCTVPVLSLGAPRLSRRGLPIPRPVASDPFRLASAR